MFMKTKNPNNEEIVICRSILGESTYGCGWTGKLTDCKKIPYSNEGKKWASLFGNQSGHYYTCPSCGLTIRQDF
jgi:hypothetical protein